MLKYRLTVRLEGTAPVYDPYSACISDGFVYIETELKNTTGEYAILHEIGLLPPNASGKMSLTATPLQVNSDIVGLRAA